MFLLLPNLQVVDFLVHWSARKERSRDKKEHVQEALFQWSLILF